MSIQPSPGMEIGERRRLRLAQRAEGIELRQLGHGFLLEANRADYEYMFDWLGVPIIQWPQDLVALQEVIFKSNPDIIIETGVAHGGSLVFFASMLCLLDLMEQRDSSSSQRKVIGVELDLRRPNREALGSHPLRHKWRIIEGSSTDPVVLKEVRSLVPPGARTLIVLDSNHSHDHVLRELNGYAQMVSLNSYCVVLDTVIADLPADQLSDRSWGPGNNPMTAIHEWLPRHPEFRVDESIDARLVISAAPQGYLRRVAP